MAPGKSFMRNFQSETGDRMANGVFHLVGTGGPLSGSSSRADYAPTGLGVAGLGSTYTDTLTGIVYINEGTPSNVYWTPLNFSQTNLLGASSDFRDGAGKAVADTGATSTIAGSGVRVFGQGIAETDSGLTVAIGEGGPVASLLTTDEASHLAALGIGVTTSLPFQPDTHGPIVVDALISMSAAITLRRMFIGFAGALADALDPIVTGVTLTLTLVLDDLAGMAQDVGLTATARLFAAHNKSDEAASHLTSATGVDTGVDLAAAGTYQRLRVEISAAGVMTCFVDKIQVTQIAAALDVDEEVGPVLYVGSTEAAIKTMLVKKFASWGSRANGA